MIMGLGLFTVAGVAGAVLFLVHQIPVKTVMFLAGGLIEDDQGTSALKKVGGLATSKPVIAVLFALPALSLAGLPPFSGFIAKLALVDAGMSSGAYVIVAVSLVGSILTLLSMTKIWIGAFWGEVTPSAVPASSRRSVTIMQTAAGIAVAGTIAIAVVAGPLWRMSEQVATDLLDRTPYIVDVLGPSRSARRRPTDGGHRVPIVVGIDRREPSCTPRRLLTVALLVGAWCALWGDVSVANVLSGTLVAVAATVFSGVDRNAGGLRIVPLLHFVWLVAVDLVVSTVQVAWEILTPTDYTDEAIIAVDTSIESRSHLLMLVVAITVTPGTAVVDSDVDTGRLYLHVLHAEKSDEIETARPPPRRSGLSGAPRPPVRHGQRSASEVAA